MLKRGLIVDIILKLILKKKLEAINKNKNNLFYLTQRDNSNDINIFL